MARIRNSRNRKKIRSPFQAAVIDELGFIPVNFQTNWVCFGDNEVWFPLIIPPWSTEEEVIAKLSLSLSFRGLRFEIEQVKPFIWADCATQPNRPIPAIIVRQPY